MPHLLVAKRLYLLDILYFHFFLENQTYPNTNHFDTTCVSATDIQMYKGDPRTCAILILAWGSNWGYSGFSHNQNNHGSSGMYVTCIYCGLSMKINTL